jgi:hypothetical protein
MWKFQSAASGHPDLMTLNGARRVSMLRRGAACIAQTAESGLGL